MKPFKAVLLTEFGGHNVVRITENHLPELSAGNVIVEMRACGVNMSDIYVRQGIFTLHNKKPPFVMGAEGSGVIYEVGDSVSGFKVGDRVMCWNFTYGMWSEFVSVRATQCYHIPENMSFEEAASVPINYVTAYLAIINFGGLAPGQKVLIQSAAGGVGWAATQLSRSVDNVTIFGTSSAHKHSKIVENGVTHPIDYRNLDFVEEVLRVSPSGVNVVLDCLSGYDFVRSRQVLKHLGRLIHVGISNMITGEKRNLIQMLKVWWQTKNISVREVIEKNHAVCGLNIASLEEEEPKTFRSAIQQVLNLYSEGKVKPRIDSVWSFDQVTEATEHMVNRKNIGKIILVPFLDVEKV